MAVVLAALVLEGFHAVSWPLVVQAFATRINLQAPDLKILCSFDRHKHFCPFIYQEVVTRML
jgi:hypothetical protein